MALSSFNSFVKVEKDLPEPFDIVKGLDLLLCDLFNSIMDSVLLAYADNINIIGRTKWGVTVDFDC